MKRLFFGLAPKPETQKQCLPIMAELAELGAPLVPAENLHVTLIYLGMTSPEQEKILIEEAAKIHFREFSTTFDKLSYWDKPDVLCLTASAMPDQLLALVSHLSTLAEKLAFALDERPYQAHATLSRKAKQAFELGFNPINWQADSFCLFESYSSEAGVKYRILETWPAAND
jgi:2'-5' RNA ligase